MLDPVVREREREQLVPVDPVVTVSGERKVSGTVVIVSGTVKQWKFCHCTLCVCVCVFRKTVFRKTVFRKTVFRKIKKKIKKMGKFFPKYHNNTKYQNTISTNTIQISYKYHKYHTNTTQIPPNTIQIPQIPYKCHTNTTKYHTNTTNTL